MNELIRELKRLPQDEATRAMIRILEKQQRDENTAWEEAEAKGKAETNLSVTKILKEKNSSLDLILLATGLTKEEIEKI